MSKNSDYQIKPKHREKFKPSEAREIMKNVFKEKFQSEEGGNSFSDLNAVTK